MNSKALFSIGYGVYALSANNDGDDNACIVNTVQQVTSSPLQITVAINKANRTHDMIKASGKFNVSVLTQSTPFSVIERFGFQSGKTADKFIGFDSAKRSAAGRISSQWDGTLTGNGMARLAPRALQPSMARSTAVLAPAITT